MKNFKFPLKIITSKITPLIKFLGALPVETLLFKSLILFVLSIIVGLNIYSRADLPPYGHPINELSNNYWGVITDIGHRWRNFDFEFWSRQLGGGLDVFSSGEYPILNPTNILAWVFNDDVFFLGKLIEPYVLGFFFMALVLWHVFKTRFYIAIFGGLAYMGLLLSRTTTMIESPYFLYGCALFPAMIFTAGILYKKHIYLVSVGVGALIALQFLMEGTTQLPQLIIWWTIMITLMVFTPTMDKTEKAQFFQQRFKLWSISILIFWLAVVGVAAMQLLPSSHFFLFESARAPGGYEINNFDLFFQTKNNPRSLISVLIDGLVKYGSIRLKVFLGLILICLALAIKNWGRIFARVGERRFFYLIWAATIIYFLIPDMALVLVKTFPPLENTFRLMTSFTFMYGLHALDLCIILTLCLMINDEQLSFFFARSSPLTMMLAWTCFILALIVAMIPLYTHVMHQSNKHGVVFDWLYQYFLPGRMKPAIKVWIYIWLMAFLLAFRPQGKIKHIILAYILVGVSFMALYDCFKWYDKGCRNHMEEFALESPEHNYFARAKGKYIVPFSWNDPPWIMDNFNMLYGVHGTCGFMALSPIRLMTFAHTYNNRFKDLNTVVRGQETKFMYIPGPIPSSFTSYFPVDFTLVQKEMDFSWKGFSKVIVGEKYDIYERQGKTDQVYFARELRETSLQELVLSFDKPRSEIVYIADNEERKPVPKEERLIGEMASTKYSNFLRKQDGLISFNLNSLSEVFVIVPEQYKDGWSVRIDGKKIEFFPAYYIFIGFKAPPGSHFIELSYRPPWFCWGLVINILSIIGMICLFKKFNNPETHA